MVLARRNELVRLTEAAVAVALSVLLGNVRLVELPNGGSIALAALPLLALAFTRGFRLTLLAGCCAGIAHALSGGTMVHPIQVLFDYPLAYAALAAAGIGARGGAGGGRWRLAPGIILAMALHMASMVVSGVVFFAPVAGSAALAYSLVYNASTVLPEALLAIWLVPPLVQALARADPADSWRRGLVAPPRLAPRTPRSIHAPATIDMVPSSGSGRLTSAARPVRVTAAAGVRARRPTSIPIPAPVRAAVPTASAPRLQPQPTQMPTSRLVRAAPFAMRPPFASRRLAPHGVAASRPRGA